MQLAFLPPSCVTCGKLPDLSGLQPPLPYPRAVLVPALPGWSEVWGAMLPAPGLCSESTRHPQSRIMGPSPEFLRGRCQAKANGRGGTKTEAFLSRRDKRSGVTLPSTHGHLRLRGRTGTWGAGPPGYVTSGKFSAALGLGPHPSCVGTEMPPAPDSTDPSTNATSSRKPAGILPLRSRLHSDLCCSKWRWVSPPRQG